MNPNTKIVIELEFGIVQSVYSNVPLEFTVIDRDVEGADSKDLIQVPRAPSDCQDELEAHRPRALAAEVLPEHVDAVYHALYK